MQRRRLLRTTGAIGVAVLAGCTGSEESEFTLQVANREITESEDGNLVFIVTVSNPGNDAQTGTLYVSSQLDGEETVRVREVSLDAHETKQITVTYDVAYANVTSFQPTADLRPSE